jgi:sugar fermentation stimulation protein A
MKYNQVVPGTFLQRPNRFIAHVLINGKEEICHVKNTGRCRELLIPGCTVYCAVSDNPQRKTKFDLIAVEKRVTYPTITKQQDLPAATTTSSEAIETNGASNSKTGPGSSHVLLVNMDSQAPNAAVKEWLRSGASPFGNIDYMKAEYKYGNSRFDFYLECKTETKRTGTAPTPAENETTRPRKIFLEVKGVTLEDNGVVLFPDAPTERGVKHVRELIRCLEEGFETYVLFVVQMERALYFTPNRKTHPQFADALCDAQKAGVQLLAYTCKVTPDEMNIDKELKVRL